MTLEEHVLSLFAEANPVPDVEQLVLEHGSAVDVGTAERMEKAMTRTEQKSMKPVDDAGSRRAWKIGAVAAGIVLALGLGYWLTALDVDPSPFPIAGAEFGADAALGIAAEYFAVYNAGEIESMFAMFTDDALFNQDFDGVPATYEDNVDPDVAQSKANWEPERAWYMAQGTQLADEECAVQGEPTVNEILVVCDHVTRDSVIAAIDSAPIPSRTALTITPRGIVKLNEQFGSPDFATTGIWFGVWLQRERPDGFELAECCGGQTVAESLTRGETYARLAAEWAAYLEENGCNYQSGC